MKRAIIHRIRREVSHFLALPKMAQLLTLSYFLRSIAYPLMAIFTGAFIWKSSSNVALLIFYSMGNFLALPIMFFVNQMLLKHFPLKHLYLTGTIVSGFGPILVMVQQKESSLAYLFYGSLYGIGAGLYWANRNFLTLTHTTSQTRSYFTGLQFSLSTLAAMLVPPIAGWFVLHVPYGYQFLIIIASSIFIISGLVIRQISIPNPDISVLTKPLSKYWNTARFLSVAIGCVDSVIYIFPTVLILSTLGNEMVLGWVNGISALLSALASYVVGRKYRQSMYVTVFPLMLIGFVVSGLPLLLGITVFSVSWYLLVSAMADSIIWIANEPVLMDMMDEEVKRSNTTHYRLIVERERFLNLGRISMLLLFLIALYLIPMYAIAIAATACGGIALGITGYSLYTRTPQTLKLPTPLITRQDQMDSLPQ